VIVSFADSRTHKVWLREPVKQFSAELQRAAYRRLMHLEAANYLHDLRIPPGNRLEKLLGDREGQHSIRLNDQWRICFTWTPAGATDVEIVDYH
jgi:proteic killer suppression protein